MCRRQKCLSTDRMLFFFFFFVTAESRVWGAGKVGCMWRCGVRSLQLYQLYLYACVCARVCVSATASASASAHVCKSRYVICLCVWVCLCVNMYIYWEWLKRLDTDRRIHVLVPEIKQPTPTHAVPCLFLFGFALGSFSLPRRRHVTAMSRRLRVCNA